MENPGGVQRVWYRPPRVEKETFIAVAWGGTAITAIFLIGRIGVRIYAFRRLYLDDLLVLLAWGMFLSSTIIWQIHVDSLYNIHQASAGVLNPIPESLPGDTVAYLEASTVVIIFYYTSLWFVKFSFLAFFRRLGAQVKSQKILWWVVFVITMLTWLSSFATPQYKCLVNTFEYIAVQCITPSALIFLRHTLVYMACVDVLTDLLIICIPVSLLWNVKISMRQKLALMGIFSLTVIIMVFAIVRVAVVASYSAQPDQSWLYLWTSIEQTVAIMVACLASFRALFVKRDETTGARRSSDHTDLLKSFKARFNRTLTRSRLRLAGSTSNNRKDSKGSGSTQSLGTFRHPTSTTKVNHSFESNEPNVPLRDIQVRNDIAVVSEPMTAANNPPKAWFNC